MTRVIWGAVIGAAVYAGWKACVDRNLPVAQGKSQIVTVALHAVNPRDFTIWLAAAGGALIAKVSA